MKIVRNALVFVVLTIPASGVAAQSCDSPSDDCGRLISASCLKRAGAGVLEAGAAPGETSVAAVGDSCAKQFDDYRACLTEVTKRCGAAPAARAGASDCTPFQEQALFQAAQSDPARIASFETACPNSPLLALLDDRATTTVGVSEALLRIDVDAGYSVTDSCTISIPLTDGRVDFSDGVTCGDSVIQLTLKATPDGDLEDGRVVFETQGGWPLIVSLSGSDWSFSGRRRANQASVVRVD